MDAFDHPPARRPPRLCACGCGRPLISRAAQARYHPFCVGVRDRAHGASRKQASRDAQAALASTRSAAIEARIELELQWIAYRRRMQR